MQSPKISISGTVSLAADLTIFRGSALESTAGEEITATSKSRLPPKTLGRTPLFRRDADPTGPASPPISRGASRASGIRSPRLLSLNLESQGCTSGFELFGINTCTWPHACSPPHLPDCLRPRDRVMVVQDVLGFNAQRASFTAHVVW